MSELAVNHLLREHEAVRRSLVSFVSLLDSLKLNPGWNSEQAESFGKFARFFREDLCALLYKEDRILYAALDGLLPGDTGPLMVLRGEHREMCLSFQRVCEIGRSLCGGERIPETLEEFQQFALKAVEVLQNHMYKEERVLFPMVARFLTPERDAELVRQMESLAADHDRQSDPQS